MGIQDALRKAAGLLVEMPSEERPAPEPETPSDDLDKKLASVDQALKGFQKPAGATKTVEQIVRDAPGPNLDQISATPEAADQPETGGDGRPGFAPIYKRAGLPDAPFSAEQMLDMMASLPADLPLDTKRQTVKVTLGALGKSIGATPETIVADASRKLAALAAYTEALGKHTAESVSKANFEIAALQAQIEEKRKAIADANARHARITEACNAEASRLDDVLEFFSLDVPPSKLAPEGKA
ncbi:MAG: hypothetical protein FJX72_06890 [Armatimonadetes bacterium]|nr:hypothetical protein [Armatimonadota bacterium]